MKRKGNSLKNILDEHLRWVITEGKAGKLANVKNWKLDKLNLQMENLPFAKLQFVSLRDANLSGINFRKADLLKGSFAGACLEGADLVGANLAGGDLSFSECMGANFTDANLEGANLEGANLSRTNFKGAILRGARFAGADLSFSQIIDANIEGTDFKGAKMEAANFKGINIDDANFDEIHREALNNKNHLHQVNFKDDTISNPPLYKTKSPESVGKNHKSDKAALNQTSNIESAKEDLFVDLDAIEPTMIEGAINRLMEELRTNIGVDQVKAICKHQNFIETTDKIDFKDGDIVIYDGQVAFKLDFEISINLSLLLDRKGKTKKIYRSRAKQIEKQIQPESLSKYRD
jgi:uncharacterized protein YjbI with pentapeptide repeats